MTHVIYKGKRIYICNNEEVIPPPGTILPTQFALSVAHRVVTNYSGSLIRVRRSSDNAEQDIGLSGGVLDTALLLSFVGAGNGFVTRIYDQFGDLDVFQTNTSQQAKIVNSGSLITIDGDPSILFDGIDDGYFFGDNRISSNYKINTTFQPTNTLTASTGMVIFSGAFEDRYIGLGAGPTTGSYGGEVLTYYTATIVPGFQNPSLYVTANIPAGETQTVIIQINHNTSVVAIKTRNGIGFTNTYQTFTDTNKARKVSAIGGNAALTGGFWNGKIRDIIYEDLN